jgi:hypothetical protein
MKSYERLKVAGAIIERQKVSANLFGRQNQGDPTTAGILGNILGPIGSGIYSGAHHGIGSGLQTGLRTGAEGVGGAGLGALLGLLVHNPELGAMFGGGLGLYHGAESSMENQNDAEPNLLQRIGQVLSKHSSRRPMLKAAVVADQFVKAAIIRQEGEGYTLFSHKGKVLGRHPSKGKAIAQEQAIKAHGG